MSIEKYGRIYLQEYTLGHCNIIKYYNSQKKKLFSVCLFFSDFEKYNNYKNNNFGNYLITTKFYAYLVGLIQSFDNIKDNFPDYEIRFYTNELFVQIYTDLVISNKHSNIINEPYNSKRSIFDYIYSFMFQIVYKYLFVNLHIYSCLAYQKYSFFGAAVRLFPFFENLDEIHIRDTDSTFGNQIDKYLINKWKQNGTAYYTVATYMPDHVKKYALDNNIVIENSVICNSIGGKSFVSNLSKETVEILLQEIFSLCDNYVYKNKTCSYGFDEIFMSVNCRKYIEYDNLKINPNINQIYKKFGNNKDLYKKFCALIGGIGFMNKYNNNDAFLNNNATVSLKIIAYILLTGMKITIDNNMDDSFFLNKCKFVIDYFHKHYRTNMDNVLLTRIIRYLLRNADSMGFSYYNEVNNNIEELFCTASLRLAYPNPIMYNDIYTNFHDKNIIANNCSAFYLDDNKISNKLLSTIVINFQKYIIYKVNKTDNLSRDNPKLVFSAICSNDNIKKIVKFCEKESGQNILSYYLDITNILRSNNINNIQIITSYMKNDNLIGSSFYTISNYFEGDELDSLIKKYDTQYNYNIIIKNLINLVLKIHSVGLTHNDLHTNNIIINNNDVFLIDCENMICYNNNDHTLNNYGFLSTLLTKDEREIFANLLIQRRSTSANSNEELFDDRGYAIVKPSVIKQELFDDRGYEIIQPAKTITMSNDYYLYLDYRYLLNIIINIVRAFPKNIDPIIRTLPTEDSFYYYFKNNGFKNVQNMFITVANKL